MRKLVLFMHASLDGFVATPKGEMDWITVDEDIFDYAGKRTSVADAALYGRKTFEMMEAYWPTAGDKPNASKHDLEHSAWYNKVFKIIVSNSMKGKHITNAKIVSENLKNEISELKEKPGGEIVIFGSPSTSHALMNFDLIDNFWIFVNPILLGEGIPLFKSISQKEKLRLLECHPFRSGVVCMHYERIR